MPKVSEEEWNEEAVVWLSPRQQLAIVLLINEVQHYAPEDFAMNSELLKELVQIKVKLWMEVKPMMFDDEVERSEIDPDLGPGPS